MIWQAPPPNATISSPFPICYIPPMRILARLFLFWLIIAPITGYFTFPLLVKKLQAKARTEVYTACLDQSAGQPEVFDPAQPAIAEGYCGCLRDGVTLSNHDVFNLLRHRQEELNDRIAKQGMQCGNNLIHPGAKDAQVLYF